MFRRYKRHYKRRNPLKFDLSYQVNPKKISKQGQIIRSDPVNVIPRNLTSYKDVPQAVNILQTISYPLLYQVNNMATNITNQQGTSVVGRISIGSWMSLIEEKIIENFHDYDMFDKFGFDMNVQSIQLKAVNGNFAGEINIPVLGLNSRVVIANTTNFLLFTYNDTNKLDKTIYNGNTGLIATEILEKGEDEDHQFPDFTSMYQRALYLTHTELEQMIEDHSWNILSVPNEITIDITKNINTTFYLVVTGTLTMTVLF